MTATLAILVLEQAFSTWLFTNSPNLGVCLVLAWATWRVAVKYTNHENRFTRIDSDLDGLKKSQKAMGKKMAKVEQRMGTMEGQLNIIILMLKRNKTVAPDLHTVHPEEREPGKLTIT